MKKTSLAIGAAILAAAAYTAAGPYLTLSGLRTAIETNDQAKLQAHIDFQLLKQNIKDQINAQAMQPVIEDPGNPFAALAAGIVTGMTDKLIDAMITPAGITAALSDKGFDGSVFDKKHKLFSATTITYDSIDTASIWIASDNAEPTRLVLTRDGFNWKLTNITGPSIHQAAQ